MVTTEHYASPINQQNITRFVSHEAKENTKERNSALCVWYWDRLYEVTCFMAPLPLLVGAFRYNEPGLTAPHRRVMLITVTTLFIKPSFFNLLHIEMYFCFQLDLGEKVPFHPLYQRGTLPAKDANFPGDCGIRMLWHHKEKRLLFSSQPLKPLRPSYLPAAMVSRCTKSLSF